MRPSTKIYLYEQYVRYNHKNKISKSAEIRLISEFIFNEFRKIESFKAEILLRNKELCEIIKIKAKWLRSKIFEDVEFSRRSICLMNRFGLIVSSLAYNDIVEISKTKYSHKWKLTIPQFKLWKGKGCENLEDQKDAMDLVRKEIEPNHLKFLSGNDKFNEIFLKLGRQCRINRLMLYSKMYNVQVFNSRALHIEHFFEALVSQFEYNEYSNRIAANYFIWYKWVDNQLKNNCINQNKNILKIWESKEIIGKISNNYDCIFDINEEEGQEKELERLKNIEEYLSKIQLK
uniref:Uncharacterized protein n=1 Tax=Meloidogyne hapla TaxID=6305 RepID=A0A1I8BFC4_MELHA